MDYRKLNAVTLGDPYPLPHVKDLINDIGKAKYITTLDLTKGYHQVLMETNSKLKKLLLLLHIEISIRYHAIWINISTLNLPVVDGPYLQGLHGFATAYLDNILICSDT